MWQKHWVFFQDYHRGVANILLHFFGFALWGYGIGARNFQLIITAPLIFESGHLINYIIGNRTKADKVMLPVQIVTWMLFVCVGVLLMRLLQTSA